MTWQDHIISFAVTYGFQIIGALLIMAVGAVLARWIGSFVQSWLERRNLEKPIRVLVVRVVRLIVLALALIAALDKLGVQVLTLVAGLGVLGVGVGLAAQGVLSNVVAGLTIMFTKPFRVGEYIELLNVYGQVIDIDLFNTTLTHPDLSRVIVPNRRLVGEIMHNYGTMRQLDLAVGVAYGSDLGTVLAVVKQVLDQHPKVLKNPAALVGVSTLGESSIGISIRPWVSVEDYVNSQAEINRALVEEFRVRNIVIPFPQREVRLLTEAPAGLS